MIEIKVDDKEVIGALNRLLEAGGDLTPAMRAISEALVDASARAFDQEQDPATGVPWKALSAVTVALRGGDARPILQRSGQLAASVQADYGRDFAAAGTNKEYAATHQFGAKQGEFGRYSQVERYRKYGDKDFRKYAGTKRGFPIPWNDIPPRPFLGIGESDKVAILDIINEHLARAVQF